jgi:hypothetical protein
MELYDWIENQRDKHLKLEDLSELENGHEIEVLVLDRNFDESIWTSKEIDVSYDPEEFFEYNKWKIKYLGDYKWDLIAPWNETYEHPIHLDITDLGLNYFWSPLDGANGDQIIMKSDSVSGKIVKLDEPIIMHVSDFPDDTRIGWRGPIMKWSDVASGGPVFWNKDNW